MKNALQGVSTEPINDQLSFETEIFKDPAQRQLLRSAVENMATQLSSGSYDAVVLLDRGGRIFGHLLKEYWRENTSELGSLPRLIFMNFGREKMSFSETGPYISEARIDALAKDTREMLDGRFDSYGTRVAILDEHVATGASVRGAREIFTRAFPQVASVDIGCFIASGKNFSDFELTPLYSESGDYWLSLPRAPSGPDTEAIFITPMRKYLEERALNTRRKITELSECELREGFNIDVVERFEIVKRSLVDDCTFYNDYIYLHLNEVEDIEGIYDLLEIFDALSPYSSLNLGKSVEGASGAIAGSHSALSLHNYLVNLRKVLETDLQIATKLINVSITQQQAWNTAVREARLVVQPEDE